MMNFLLIGEYDELKQKPGRIDYLLKKKKPIYLLHLYAKESREPYNSHSFDSFNLYRQSSMYQCLSLFWIIIRRSFIVCDHKNLLFFGFFPHFCILIAFRKHITVNGVPHWSLFLEQSARSKVIIRPCRTPGTFSTIKWYASIRKENTPIFLSFNLHIIWRERETLTGACKALGIEP